MTEENNKNPEVRGQPRVPFEAKVNIEFEKFSGFISEYSSNLSLGGMFIKTDEPKPVGTVLSFEFRLSDNFKLIQGLGEVCWVRSHSDGTDRPAGMGIRFHDLDSQSKELIQTILEQHREKGGQPYQVEGSENETAEAVPQEEESAFDSLFADEIEEAAREKTEIVSENAVGQDEPTEFSINVDSPPEAQEPEPSPPQPPADSSPPKQPPLSGGDLLPDFQEEPTEAKPATPDPDPFGFGETEVDESPQPKAPPSEGPQIDAGPSLMDSVFDEDTQPPSDPPAAAPPATPETPQEVPKASAPPTAGASEPEKKLEDLFSAAPSQGGKVGPRGNRLDMGTIAEDEDVSPSSLAEAFSGEKEDLENLPELNLSEGMEDQEEETSSSKKKIFLVAATCLILAGGVWFSKGIWGPLVGLQEEQPTEVASVRTQTVPAKPKTSDAKEVKGTASPAKTQQKPAEEQAATTSPTAIPTQVPTAKPTVKPTPEPTKAPTATPTPEPTVKPTPEPTAQKETAVAEATPAQKAQGLDSQRVVRNIVVQKGKTTTVVTVETNMEIGKDEYEHLRISEGKPREVIDIFQVSRPYEKQKILVNTAQLRQIRTGLNRAEDGSGRLRLVMDLPNPSVRLRKIGLNGQKIHLYLK